MLQNIIHKDKPMTTFSDFGQAHGCDGGKLVQWVPNTSPNSDLRGKKSKNTKAATKNIKQKVTNSDQRVHKLQ